MISKRNQRKIKNSPLTLSSKPKKNFSLLKVNNERKTKESKNQLQKQNKKNEQEQQEQQE